MCSFDEWVLICMKSTVICFLGMLAVFILLRSFAVPFMYYGDEYKFALIVDPVEKIGGTLLHPPFAEIIMHFGGLLFGFDNLRIVPLVFSILNAILVFMILSRYFSTASAFGGLLLLTVSVWHILASTMIGVDGCIVPFFFLLAAYSFFRYEEKSMRSKYWLVLSIFSASAGMLTKLDFVLFFPTLFVYLWWKQREILQSIKAVMLYAFAAFIVILLWIPLLKLVYPYFNIWQILGYASSYSVLNLVSRDYFHIAFLLVQTLFYASPLLPGVFALSVKKLDGKNIFFFSWITISFIFYIFVIDFSHKPIERYLMGTIYPMVILGGSILKKTLNLNKKLWIGTFVLVLLVSLLFGFILNTMPAKMLPIYPKTAYFDRILSGDLNFYVPFTGGNGPMGFQVVALSLIVMYLLPLFFVFLGLIARSRNLMLFCLVVFFAMTLSYNFLLDEEFLFSTFSPNVQKVAKESVRYVLADPHITKLITYNDIGAYELTKAGKYNGRFYSVPEYFAENFKKFQSHNESKFLIVDFPQINREGPYWQYFSKCQTLETFDDKGIVLGYLFDCSQST